MKFTRHQALIVLATAGVYLIGQLVAGTGFLSAALFSTAILFGLLSVFAGGGLESAFGCLNAVLIGKFLLFAIGVKILLLEPADGTLHSSTTTALVMALGFFGLFLGTLFQSKLSSPQQWSLNRPFNDRLLLAFSIVLFVVSYVASFAALVPETQGEGIQTGGWLGVARALGSLRAFAIVPPMLLLWRLNTRRWMTHPIILTLLAWSLVVGVFSTSKQDAMEPIAFYALVGFLRRGWRDSRIWGFLAVGAAYYALIVFPYSQYVRDNGGRQGSFTQRLEATKQTFLRIVTDRSFRSEVTDRVSNQGYFHQPSLTPFSRLAMVGEADRLISTTEEERAYTGWETITWGFKLATPSFLYKDKPIFEANNYMAHIVGDVGDGDMTTQVSYGVMANFYNAFSLTGVVIGVPLFFGLFYYWIRVFLGDPRCSNTPTMSTLWFLWLIATFQHSIVESSVSGLIASVTFPIPLIMLYLMARWLSVFLPVSEA